MTGKRTNIWPIVGVLLALLITWLCLMGAVYCRGQEPSCSASWAPPAGSVIATSNLNEADNGFPGSLNHLMTVVGRGNDGRIYVVEAQQGVYGNGVQYAALDDVLRRPYRQPLVWIPRNPAIGARAAAIAQTQVGQPYGRYASLGPQRIRGLVPAILGVPRRQNCVSVVRQQYEGATGLAMWGFNIPDDVGRRPDLFCGPYLLPQSQPQSLDPAHHGDSHFVVPDGGSQ